MLERVTHSYKATSVWSVRRSLSTQPLAFKFGQCYLAASALILIQPKATTRTLSHLTCLFPIPCAGHSFHAFLAQKISACKQFLSLLPRRSKLAFKFAYCTNNNSVRPFPSVGFEFEDGEANVRSFVAIQPQAERNARSPFLLPNVRVCHRLLLPLDKGMHRHSFGIVS